MRAAISKRVSVAGYIAAWVIAGVAVAVFFSGGSVRYDASSASAVATTQPAAVASVALVIATLVMLMAWIAALLALARQRQWGWFVVVLILQLVGLGIFAMIAYAISGPPRRPILTVTRPSVT